MSKSAASNSKKIARSRSACSVTCRTGEPGSPHFAYRSCAYIEYASRRASQGSFNPFQQGVCFLTRIFRSRSIKLRISRALSSDFPAFAQAERTTLKLVRSGFNLSTPVDSYNRFMAPDRLRFGKQSRSNPRLGVVPPHFPSLYCRIMLSKTRCARGEYVVFCCLQ